MNQIPTTITELDTFISQLEVAISDVLKTGNTKVAAKINILIGNVIDIRNKTLLNK